MISFSKLTITPTAVRLYSFTLLRKRCQLRLLRFDLAVNIHSAHCDHHEYKEDYDMNCDGVISAGDYGMMISYINESIFYLPVDAADESWLTDYADYDCMFIDKSRGMRSLNVHKQHHPKLQS